MAKRCAVGMMAATVILVSVVRESSAAGILTDPLDGNVQWICPAPIDLRGFVQHPTNLLGAIKPTKANRWLFRPWENRHSVWIMTIQFTGGTLYDDMGSKHPGPRSRALCAG
jgi:hypothetical protein